MKSTSITHYATLVFDCDGVVLNSNRVKTEAFRQVALPYGEAAADAFVAYHMANGGISRYKKFAYFLDVIVPSLADLSGGATLDEMLTAYADKVRDGLLACEVADGLPELRQQTGQARWLIVSGGDQTELREVFEARQLAELFDGGIFGSPDTKENILARECECNNIRFPALFLGDSKYDYKAACSQSLDFLFISAWTDVKDWQDWSSQNSILSKDSIHSVLNMS